MKIKPYRGYLLVEIIEQEEVIVTGDDSHKSNRKGKVLDIGYPEQTDYGYSRHPRVVMGDTVILEQFADKAYQFEEEGKLYALVKDSWVMGVEHAS